MATIDGEANSWIRRTNFSHTVCHRLDSVASFHGEPIRIAGMKTRPSKPSNPSQNQANSITSKYRTVTPPPKSTIPETFIEARSNTKRFSTPHPHRVETEKGLEKGYRGDQDQKMFKFERNLTMNVELRCPTDGGNVVNLKQFSSMKVVGEKRKMKRESSWSKLFGVGRVGKMGKEYVADASEVYFGESFAGGRYSQIHSGLYKGEEVAIKMIRVFDDDDEENEEVAVRVENQYRREIKFLSRLHHPHVIKFLGACRIPAANIIILEMLSQGSLRGYLHKLEYNTGEEKKFLPLQNLINMALQITRGMDYIHSQGIIHRDLKPENILIDKDFKLKIADFGIACEEAYCDFLADDPGTYRWMAPEMIKRKPYGRKVDVYGFGLILWEMVAGSIPYKDMTPIQAAFAVVHKDLRPSFPPDCPRAMKALIEQCWCTNPDKRPEFWQIVRVLEEFETIVARDGNLNHLQNSGCLDHKKGLRHWIQKLGPHHQHHYHQHQYQPNSPMPKPRFS